jgi:hypothetical protein
MKKLIFLISATTALLLVAVGTSHATSMTLGIGPDSGCVAECLNTQWSISFSDENVVESASYNLHMTLTADWPDADDFFIDEDGVFDPTVVTAVEFGLPGRVQEANLTSPTASSPDEGWSNELGPLGGQGCGDHNGNFTCSEGIAEIVMGESMTWEWDILVNNVSEIFDPETLEDFHIGAKLEREGEVSTLAFNGNGNGNKVHDTGWLLSVSPVSPIPEPSSGLLYFVGILVASRRLGRRH